AHSWRDLTAYSAIAFLAVRLILPEKNRSRGCPRLGLYSIAFLSCGRVGTPTRVTAKPLVRPLKGRPEARDDVMGGATTGGWAASRPVLRFDGCRPRRWSREVASQYRRSQLHA